MDDPIPPPDLEPEDKKKTKKDKTPFMKRVKEDERLNKGVNYLWDHRIEIFSSALTLVGIILSFFYIHIGGTLVGLGFGLCFFDEVHNYFLQLRDFYIEQGLFKTLMWIGTILYFLIAIPAFIISAAIGYAAIFLIRWSFKK